MLDEVPSNAKFRHLRGMLTHLQDLRAEIHAEALALADEYAERREALGHGFCNLNLVVQSRNQGRGIYLYWCLLHFKRAKKVYTILPKPKTSRDFDLTAIDNNAPEWIRPLAREVERRARPMRETLAELTSLERRLRVIAGRNELPDIYQAPDEIDVDALFPTFAPGDTSQHEDFA